MNKLKQIFYTMLALVVLNACQDFEELEKNENKPNQVPPSLVLNGVLNDLYERPWSLEHRQNQYWLCNYNYYGTNEYWSAASLNFMTLKNIIKMEEEAKKSGAAEVNPYAAIGKFLRAYFYVRMTQRVGDVPLTDALKGLENPTPEYTDQKTIYIQVLDWLDKSNNELGQLIAAGNTTLQGDIYLNNNLAKWQKVVNSFTLRVLISLSRKEGDSELKIKERFASILDNPGKYPVMASLEDNLAYIYNGTTNLYPLNPGNRGFDKNRYNLSSTHIGLLTTLKDPRVFVVANPSKAKLAAGVKATSFDAFVGANPAESLDNMSSNAGKGEYSFINQARYYGSLKGPEPGVQIGYAEQCFTIAEGINRGWATGDAGQYYINGITASMKFYDIINGAEINITESDNDAVVGKHIANLTEYFAQPAVVYAGNNANGLKQILEQKYLAMFQQSGQEAYFNFRRTGIPEFKSGAGTGNNNTIPKRWLYPVAERTNNTGNYNAAVAAQFGSAGDNLNSELWLNQ